MRKFLCMLLLVLPTQLLSQSSAMKQLYSVTDSSAKITAIEYLDVSSVHRQKNLVFAMFHRDIISFDKTLLIEMNMGMVFDCSDKTAALLIGKSYDIRGKMLDSISVPSLREAIWFRENHSREIKLKINLFCIDRIA